MATLNNTKKRKVEVYIGFDDHTWDTKMVEIPEDTPEMWVKEAAEKKALYDVPITSRNVSFIGIYNKNVD